MLQYEILISALLNIHQNLETFKLVYILIFNLKKKVGLRDTKLSSAYSCIKPSVIQQLPQTFHTRTLHMYYSWPAFIEVLTKVVFSFFFFFRKNAHNSWLTSSGYIKTESPRPSLNFTYPGWPLKLGRRARIICRFVTASVIILQESKHLVPVGSQSLLTFTFVCCLVVVVFSLPFSSCVYLSSTHMDIFSFNDLLPLRLSTSEHIHTLLF